MGVAYTGGGRYFGVGLKLLPYPGHMFHILAVIVLSEIEILKKSPAAPTSCQ